jgi:putative Mn2+ efflux pump MntP
MLAQLFPISRILSHAWRIRTSCRCGSINSMQSDICSAADIRAGGSLLRIHHDLVELGKVCAVAFAVGLDVLAISVGVGVTQLAFDASLRVGIAFAGSEIAMQLIGYELGTGIGRMLGEVAQYAGLVLLAALGLTMIRKSLRDTKEASFDATKGVGLLLAALSISLDSLGVGIALPSIGIPLVPLLITVSISTTAFTLIGLAFGARLGVRYEHRAERAAGAMLVLLAAAFALGQFV